MRGVHVMPIKHAIIIGAVLGFTVGFLLSHFGVL